MRTLRLAPFGPLALVGFVLGSVGCGAAVHPPAVAPVATTAPEAPLVAASPVADEAFADELFALLANGAPSPERTRRLGGVVARQLARAGACFARKNEDRGLASLEGAMLLVRAGELTREMIAASDAPLAAALAVVARRGDEGRSLAVYHLRASVAKAGSPESAELAAHLGALATWTSDTRKGEPLETTGANERAAVARALIEPTPEALADARAATVAWLDRAVAFGHADRSPLARPKREEALEAFRAFRSGAETLVALHLRSGDAPGALEAVEASPSAKRLLAPAFHERLVAAASGGDARAWNELASVVYQAARASAHGRGDDDAETPEVAMDASVLRAAVFGTVLEAFRADPGDAATAVQLASLVARLGMEEAAPLVLARAMGPRASTTEWSAALDLVLELIGRAEQADDPDAARRVFAASRALLDAASSDPLGSRVRPSPARVRLAMGLVEAHAGEIAAARDLLASVAADEMSPEAALTLATIARQMGDAPGTDAALARGLALADASSATLASAELHLFAADLALDRRDRDRAKSEAALALGRALDARKAARESALRARAERVLARVLDRYGDVAGTARAVDRALAFSTRDPSQLAVTLLESAARAFVRRDVTRARAALRRALDASLPDDDVVYLALWARLAERQTKALRDDTAESTLAAVKDEGWTGKLALWATGRLADAALAGAAKTAVQRAEAAFYLACAKRLAGDEAGATAGFRDVASSPTIDLFEARMARDLLLGQARQVDGGVPKHTSVP